jgi:hypothetical protein
MSLTPQPTKLETGAGRQLNHGGSVVDIRFDAYLPPICSLPLAKEGEIAPQPKGSFGFHSTLGADSTHAE